MRKGAEAPMTQGSLESEADEVEDGTKTRKVRTPKMDEDGTEVATGKVDTMSMEMMDIEK
jgi:hypothetical protein